jgi:hypothetical protein
MTPNPPLPPIPFVRGQQYTRADIYAILDIPLEGRKGDLHTGYHRHGADWEGTLLRWRGETNARLGHPAIQSMLSPATRKLIFTREDNREPFVFRGLATPARWEDTTPVTVWWGFNDPNGGGDSTTPTAFRGVRHCRAQPRG